MKKPLVSFIIPIYNVAPYVEKCITSILDQSFGDFEIIAVNDGSTDNCEAILETLRAKDPRVRVIHKKNNGVSSARNAGIAAAEGTWLYFLDGDDFLIPGSMGKAILYLDENYDAVMTGITSEDANPEIDGVKVAVCNEHELTKNFDLIGWSLFSVCGKFYKKDVLIQNNLWFNEKMVANEDQAFALTWMGVTSRILALENQTYGYYMREDSTIHTTRDPRSEMGSYVYYCQYLEKNPKIVESSTLFCNMFVGYSVYKMLEGLSLDGKTREMRKIMEDPLVIRALSNVTVTQKDKMLVCDCIRKKAVMPLTVLFNLKHAARKAKPLFNCIKKLTR